MFHIPSFKGKTVNGVTIADGAQVLYKGHPAVIVRGRIFCPRGLYGQWSAKFPATADEAAWQTEHILRWGGVYDGPTRITEPVLAPNPDPATHVDYAAHMAAYTEMMERS